MGRYGTRERELDDLLRRDVFVDLLRVVRNGIERAGKTLRHIDWFEITQIRGQAKDGAVEHFQVGMKVGFRLEDE